MRDARCALVIDYASRIARQPDRLDAAEHRFFVAAERISLASHPIVPKGADIASPNGKARFNPILWLVNRGQDLPSWLALDSTRVAALTLGLPDYETRLEAAKHLGNLFPGYEQGTPETHGKFARDFAQMTDGLPLVALADIAQLADRLGLGFRDVGAALNAHLHFHCVVIDGVVAPAPSGGAVFHPAGAIDPPAIATVQATLRRRLLASFVRRGLLEENDARAMAQWAHGGGFSVDGSVRIEAADRAGRERLLRYCARPAFALERLRELDTEHLLCDSAKPGSGAPALRLTPLELLEPLAALVPPPRVHRHRYFGVLAPNSPWRAAVTARAPAAAPTPPTPPPELPVAEPAHHRAARYAWAMLLARIYEVFLLACSRCGAQMRIIAFITDPATIHDLLRHLGEPTAPPRIAPALGPPLGDLSDARTGDCDPHAQPAPAYEFDQRLAW